MTNKPDRPSWKEKLDQVVLKCKASSVWIRGSFERTAVSAVIIGSVLVCALLLFIPSSSDGGGEGHGHEEEEGGHEAGVEIDDDVLEASSMSIEQAKATQIHPQVSARGQIVENGNKAMNVKPRFGGIVKAVYKDFGDQVRKGDTLLSIESPVTRSSYTIRTVIDGIVADKRVVAGAFVPENESVFRIVDLSSVWFQTSIPIKDADKLVAGLVATVKDKLQGIQSEGSILNVSPMVAEDTQACDVRIVIENPKGEWKVGAFAEALLSLPSVDAGVTVKSTALQEFNGQTVIFKRIEDRIVAAPVTIGASDQEWSEVLSGVAVGDSYVASNSFLAKAELLKSTAAHEH